MTILKRAWGMGGCVRELGMTLVELLVAIGIAFAVLGTLTFGYIQAYRMTDATTLQSAAHRLVVDRLDIVRQATWRNHGATNEMKEFGLFTSAAVVAELELPLLTTNRVLMRLTTEVTELVDPDPPLVRIEVTGVWTNLEGRVFTQSLTTLRAPD